MNRIFVATVAALVFAAPLRGAETTASESQTTTSERLDVVAEFHGPMPAGVTVSKSGRIFVSIPRWGDDVEFTVAEVKGGKTFAYPSQDLNTTPSAARQANGLVSVQSVVVDPADRLWLLDTGSIGFGPTTEGGPKLLCVDLKSDKIIQKIQFPPSVALPNSYLNDMRFDLRRRKAGFAFISDSGAGGLIVVNLESGQAWRRLGAHPSAKAEPGFVATIEGQPFMRQPQPDAKPQAPQVASDGIAISSDGKRLFYCALSSRKLYSVNLDVLADPKKDDEDVMMTVKEEPARRGASDGLESDDKGNLYMTDYENNGVVVRGADGSDHVLIENPRLLWPDTLSVARDGFLYIMANQLHRQKDFHGGKDMREKPYLLVRTPIVAGPVLLK